MRLCSSQLCQSQIRRIAGQKKFGTRRLERRGFAAQWLAYALPYRRFVAVLADANARLGADVDRYSFIVVDLHHLLLAGLPAHFESHMLGRSAAPTTGSIDAALFAARTGSQGDPARPGEAAVAAASSTEPH